MATRAVAEPAGVLRVVERVVADPAEAPVRAAMLSSRCWGSPCAATFVRIPPLADLAPDRLVATLAPTCSTT